MHVRGQESFTDGAAFVGDFSLHERIRSRLWETLALAEQTRGKRPALVLGMPCGGPGLADCVLCHEAFDFHRLVCTHVGVLGGLAIEHN